MHAAWLTELGLVSELSVSIADRLERWLPFLIWVFGSVGSLAAVCRFWCAARAASEGWGEIALRWFGLESRLWSGAQGVDVALVV